MNALANGILISGIIQGIILVVLLLRKDINHLPNRLLAFIIFLLSVHLSLVAVDIDNQFLRFPHLSKITYLLPVLYGPLILLFTYSIVEVDFRFRKWHLLFLLLFLIYFFLLLPYYRQSSTEKITYLSDTSRVLRDDLGWMNQFTNLLHISFVAAALIIFYQRKKRLIGYFSNPGRVLLSWLEQFLLIVFIVITLSVASFYSKRFGLPNFPEVYPYHFILVVILVYWIGFRMVQDPTIFTVTEKPFEGEPEFPVNYNEEEEPGDESDNNIKYRKSGMDLEEVKSLAVQVKQYMEEYKPFLNPNLTLNDLSSELQITKHQLSQVINSEFNKNFFEFINDYRILEFKREVALEMNKHLSILGIALNCGFNSKATFNMAFKKTQGITPSEYIRRSEMV